MENKVKSSPHRKLSAMLLISFLIMYSVMFLNVDKAEHIYLSTTRLYMTFLMVSPMALLMLIMMSDMYPSKNKNSFIIILSILAFIFSLAGLRTQTLVADRQYMKAMIPHHSSAILTSKNADIKDPELKALSLDIISSQEEEIKKMKAILKRIDD